MPFNETSADLQKALAPLSAVVEQASKILLKEAHEAIFAAEKQLMGHEGSDNPVLTGLYAKMSKLKELVMQPFWEKQDIITAIDSVRQAGANLESGIEAETAKLQETEAKKTELQAQVDAAESEKAALLAEATAATTTAIEVAEGAPAVVTLTAETMEQTTTLQVVETAAG